MYITGSIPLITAYLDTGFLHNKPADAKSERILVEIFSFTSLPRRCGLFTCMTEMGTQHARVPINYFWKEKSGGGTLPLDFLELWDSFSYYFTGSAIDYLKNGRASIILKNKKTVTGDYLMSFDWALGSDYQGGYGEMAAGHKTGHLFWSETGQLLLQPNNRIFWKDGGAFISRSMDGKEKWNVFSKEFSCEKSGSRWFVPNEEEDYFYDFEESGDAKINKDDLKGKTDQQIRVSILDSLPSLKCCSCHVIGEIVPDPDRDPNYHPGTYTFICSCGNKSYFSNGIIYQDPEPITETDKFLNEKNSDSKLPFTESELKDMQHKMCDKKDE